MSVEAMTDTQHTDAPAVPETPPAVPSAPREPTVSEATDPDGTQIVCVSLHGPDDAGVMMTLEKEDWVRLSAEYGTVWGRKGYGKRRYITALSGGRCPSLSRLISGAAPGSLVHFVDYNRRNFRRRNLEVVSGTTAATIIEKGAANMRKRRASRGVR